MCICLVLLGLFMAFVGEKVIFKFIRHLITFMVSWQLFEFVYNVVLHYKTPGVVAIVVLVLSIGLGYLVGKYTYLIIEKYILQMIVAWLGLVIASIILKVAKVDELSI